MFPTLDTLALCVYCSKKHRRQSPREFICMAFSRRVIQLTPTEKAAYPLTNTTKTIANYLKILVRVYTFQFFFSLPGEMSSWLFQMPSTGFTRHLLDPLNHGCVQHLDFSDSENLRTEGIRNTDQEMWYDTSVQGEFMCDKIVITPIVHLKSVPNRWKWFSVKKRKALNRLTATIVRQALRMKQVRGVRHQIANNMPVYVNALILKPILFDHCYRINHWFQSGKPANISNSQASNCTP